MTFECAVGQRGIVLPALELLKSTDDGKVAKLAADIQGSSSLFCSDQLLEQDSNILQTQDCSDVALEEAAGLLLDRQKLPLNIIQTLRHYLDGRNRSKYHNLGNIWSRLSIAEFCRNVN